MRSPCSCAKRFRRSFHLPSSVCLGIKKTTVLHSYQPLNYTRGPTQVRPWYRVVVKLHENNPSPTVEQGKMEKIVTLRQETRMNWNQSHITIALFWPSQNLKFSRMLCVSVTEKQTSCTRYFSARRTKTSLTDLFIVPCPADWHSESIYAAYAAVDQQL